MLVAYTVCPPTGPFGLCMRVIAVLMFVGLMSCDAPQPQTDTYTYYDVAGYIQKQITQLTADSVGVLKTVGVDQDKQTLGSRRVDWKRELDLFGQADLNKPALRNSYQVSQPDAYTYRYTLKPTETHLPVQWLLVQLDSASRQPRHIEAVFVNKNPLYTSERHIRLISGAAPGGRWQVRAYELTGYQQLRFFDKNEFLVTAQVQ